MNSASVGDRIKYAGLTLAVAKILQPYDLGGNMLMPIVELIDVADDSVWGYLDLSSLFKLKKEQGARTGNERSGGLKEDKE